MSLPASPRGWRWPLGSAARSLSGFGDGFADNATNTIPNLRFGYRPKPSTQGEPKHPC